MNQKCKLTTAHSANCKIWTWNSTGVTALVWIELPGVTLVCQMSLEQPYRAYKNQPWNSTSV